MSYPPPTPTPIWEVKFRLQGTIELGSTLVSDGTSLRDALNIHMPEPPGTVDQDWSFWNWSSTARLDPGTLVKQNTELGVFINYPKGKDIRSAPRYRVEILSPKGYEFQSLLLAEDTAIMPWFTCLTSRQRVYLNDWFLVEQGRVTALSPWERCTRPLTLILKEASAVPQPLQAIQWPPPSKLDTVIPVPPEPTCDFCKVETQGLVETYGRRRLCPSCSRT